MYNQVERSTHIFRDISLLYELALSIGQSLDMDANIKDFLDILFSRKSLSYVSAWVREDEGFILRYARPYFRVKQTGMTEGNKIWEKLNKADNGSFSERVSESVFRNMQDFANKGVLVFFKLGDLGFVVMHDAKREMLYSQSEINQLSKVMDKLNHSVAGCLAYERLNMAQQKIVESETRFRRIINTSHDGVIIIDTRGRIREWNKESESLFGYKSEEVLKKPLTELILLDHWRKKFANKPSRISKYLEKAVQQHKRYELDVKNRWGYKFPIEIGVSSFNLDKNLYYSLFFRDITKRKEAEASLIHAKQVAEKARLAEQQFLANMSHEIRTPMNAVIGMTHLLYKSSPNSEQTELLDALKFSADSLLEILNNILDLSKIEAGELEMEEKPFNLNALLQSLHKSASMKSKGSDVDVILEFDSEIQDYLIGDRTMLNQVLTNLVSNALKFTDTGYVKLKASLTSKRSERYTIQFQVSDTGIGIPVTKQDMVFRDFKQVTSSTHGGQKNGAGLGLAIVKRLLSLMGGIIHLDSQLGVGSTFSFSLDFQRFKTAILLGDSSFAKPNRLDSVKIKGLKVLVVEDNPMNQKLITKILDGWGISYQLAENGKVAVRLSEQTAFHLVLMDIHMPEMNGVDATSIIRNSESNLNRNVPIIALTAAAILEEKREAIRAGMNDFMTKPFSPAVLKRMMKKWVFNQAQLKEKTLSMQKERHESLDLSYLKELSGGDKVFIGEMLETFLTETKDILKDLDEVESCNDHQRTFQVAHKLKSSLKMMGMRKAADLCVLIEEKARAEKSDEILLKTIKDLKERVEHTIPFLKEEIDLLQQ